MKYGLILADPPWQFKQYSDSTKGSKNSRRTDEHYEIQSVEWLCELPVASVARADCVLMMWSTFPNLEESLRVMSAWGFAYKSGYPWLKLTRDMLPRMGCGFHARACSELMLIGTRGRPTCPGPSERPTGVLFSGTGRHSEKPLTIYDRAELYEGPYLELFARPLGDLISTLHPHWTRLGNEIDGRDMLDALKEAS